MKNISVKKYAIALYELVEDAEQTKVAEIITSFVRVLIQNKDTNKIDKIIRAFTEYYNQKQGKIEITITTAEEIKDQLEAIQTKLKSNFGKDIDLKTKIDPSIIGGVILKYGDNIADGSIKRKVQLLAESLNK
ncbi:MAG: ATP synthase F1 subunit delta [bacterium]|nr:ATP synthase F1 subunit delta [bacterium]